ncbi:MAG TPA: phosphoribosylformylglycinamidine synthase subunit PurL [Verrucomicrobiae bacterium]|nr:phosphoribosylformylglycinamidine synthase subunit PurL [Verrucomicrobiae bacterium]
MTVAAAAEGPLDAGERRRVAERLGREASPTELAMLGVLWSEHCSYRTSRRLLRQLPVGGPRVVQGPGENAGVVDLGGDLLCCFKIESHNHPSAVEPVQGAATGVGGILRDVFAMGARPVALLDAIRFGEPTDPVQALRFARVVEGIGWYGNCVGVPTVGGETVFDPAYRDNCLVNAMCVGLVARDRLRHARASGPGNLVLLVGADTGRDGIGGAAFASAAFDHDREQKRPAVQVGNPFLEKCLIEACQELATVPGIVALQDCGAAGLTSSCAEMAHRGGVGLDLDVAQVSRRERQMTPAEVMLSESQERMVLVVEPAGVAQVRACFERWGLHSDAIGTVTASGRLRVRDGAVIAADLPLDLLVAGSPEHRPPAHPPADLAARRARDPLDGADPPDPRRALQRLLLAGNCGEARWVWRQYDHMVGDDTVSGPGGDAAVLRLRGRDEGLALTVDGGHRSSPYAPRTAAAAAVFEAARNLAAVGAEPLAVTNCLNCGSPDQPVGMWQLEETVAGLGDACRALGIPIVSGNVSLYNDTLGHGIPPTAVVGMVGRLAPLARRAGIGFAAPGHTVLLVGPPDPSAEPGAGLGGSELQRVLSGGCHGPAPVVDADREASAQRLVRGAIRAGLLASAHDLSLGGLAVALTDACCGRGVGCSIQLPAFLGTDRRVQTAWLFGEVGARFLVSCEPASSAALRALADDEDVPVCELGTTGGDELSVLGLLAVPLAELGAWWGGAIAGALAAAGRA